MRSALRLMVAIAIAFTYALCGFGAGGFGEGWITAMMVGFGGCVLLGFAVNNGLRKIPSRPSAVFHLLLAVGSTVVLYVRTQQEGIEYFHRAVRYAPGTVSGFLVGLAAFYAFPILALLRRGPTHLSSGHPNATCEADAHIEH